ncbi:hypothetical protein PG994_001431 [Apiospora phragmitis]|uniref:Uncharacterized protein n=1 Tax=Apiospora phragmitis TaxID=2905665 RepID=A0ABR1WTJ7_9PEZI
MSDVYERFEPMGQYVYVDIDCRSHEWKTQRDNQDLEIYCDADHIIQQPYPIDPDVTWWDTTRFCPVGNNAPILQLKDPASHALAVCSSAVPDGNQEMFPPNWAESFAWNSRQLITSIDQGYIFGLERIQKVLYPSLLTLVRQASGEYGQYMKQIDLLGTLEFTMVEVRARACTTDADYLPLLHFSHLVRCGSALNLRGSDSYGWASVIELQTAQNAGETMSPMPRGPAWENNLAMFALIVQLIRHWNIDVDDDGKLVQFS